MYTVTSESEFTDCERRRREKHEALDRLEAETKRAIAAIERKIADLTTAHIERWGSDDSDRRRYDNSHYHGIAGPNFQRTIAGLRAEIAQHQNVTLNYEMPKRRRSADEDYWENLPPKSRLQVTPIPVPSSDDDAKIKTLTDELAQCETARQEALDRIASIEPLIVAKQQRVVSVRLEAEHGLANATDVARSEKEAGEADRAHRGYLARISAADARIVEIDAAIGARRSKLETDATATIGALIPGTVREAADALMPALEAVTRLRWLLADDRAPQTSIPRPALTFADVRDFLDAARDAGWQPKEGK